MIHSSLLLAASQTVARLITCFAMRGSACFARLDAGRTGPRRGGSTGTERRLPDRSLPEADERVTMWRSMAAERFGTQRCRLAKEPSCLLFLRGGICLRGGCLPEKTEPFLFFREREIRIRGFARCADEMLFAGGRKIRRRTEPQRAREPSACGATRSQEGGTLGGEP